MLKVIGLRLDYYALLLPVGCYIKEHKLAGVGSQTTKLFMKIFRFV